MTKEQWIEKMGKHNTDKYETFPVPEGMKEGFKLIEPKQENGALIYTGSPDELAVIVLDYIELRHEVGLQQYKENLVQFLTNHPVHHLEDAEEYVWEIAGIKPNDTVEEIEVVAERIWPDMTQPSAVMELKAVPNNNIIFHTNYGKTEVLRFTETEVFVYGEKIECPQDIVDGMRTFLKGVGNEAI